MKVRVTIAASGQGRWGEELDFPVDCVNSGFKPVLLVLDPTPNPKLDELRKVFLENKGLEFIGDEAWQHLDGEAGPTMARFLETYVRKPISDLLRTVPEDLPAMTLGMAGSRFTVQIGSDVFAIERTPEAPIDEEAEIPEDVEEQMPGCDAG